VSCAEQCGLTTALLLLREQVMRKQVPPARQRSDGVIFHAAIRTTGEQICSADQARKQMLAINSRALQARSRQQWPQQSTTKKRTQ